MTFMLTSPTLTKSFGSLLFILALTYRLDSSLSTNTIILIGIIFSMFVSSISNFIITMAGDHVKTITFWTLGSLQNSSYKSALLVFVPLVICGGILLSDADELNAFSVGEDNARNMNLKVFWETRAKQGFLDTLYIDGPFTELSGER